MKVTVITPFYNGEKYIGRFIGCLLKQNYTEFQAILIDDGSNDSSLKICRNLTQGDPRFLIIKGNHEGVSAARNVGLTNVTTELVTFMDIDDTVEPNHLEVLIKNQQKYNADIVSTGIKYQLESGKIIFTSSFKNENVDLEKAILSSFMLGGIQGVVCNKLFKTDIIKSGHIVFDERFKRYEDHKFSIEYLLRCKSFCNCNEPTYNYFKHENSAIAPESTPVLEVDVQPYMDIANDIADANVKSVNISKVLVYVQVDIAIRHLMHVNSLEDRDNSLSFVKRNMSFTDIFKGQSFRLVLRNCFFYLSTRFV